MLIALIFVSATGCSRPSGPMLIDDDAPTEFTTTASGLKYRILRKSNQQKPLPSSKVEVDYRGWLDDGSTFDSSYNMREPASFSLSKVIPAWTEGLQLLGEGGMIELEVPSELGYGETGNPPSIPPNATLHFKVELLRILN
ncbi:MAG: FKBP-type peptidylprolyl isomerase [Rhodopirellula sp.]|nr:FKBP-type peptidylprolyl isomerase [Rhodopirellula sp.]